MAIFNLAIALGGLTIWKKLRADKDDKNGIRKSQEKS